MPIVRPTTPARTATSIEWPPSDCARRDSQKDNHARPNFKSMETDKNVNRHRFVRITDDIGRGKRGGANAFPFSPTEY